MAAIPAFSPSDHKPTERKPVPNSPPDGWPVVLTDGTEKQTRDGRGSYIALIFEITDGEYKGRKLFHNLNLNNPNPEAVKFAYDDLYYLCLACGVTTTVDDTQRLVRLPLRVVTKLKERKPLPGQAASGELQTVITEFRRRDGSSVMPKDDKRQSAPNGSPSAAGEKFWS